MYSRFTPRGKSAGRLLAKTIGVMSGASLGAIAIAGVVKAGGSSGGGHGVTSGTPVRSQVRSPAPSLASDAVPVSSAKAAEPQPSYSPPLGLPESARPAPPPIRERRIRPIDEPPEKPFVYVFHPARREVEIHVEREEPKHEETTAHRRVHPAPTTTHSTPPERPTPPPETKRQPAPSKPPTDGSHSSQRHSAHQSPR